MKGHYTPVKMPIPPVIDRGYYTDDSNYETEDEPIDDEPLPGED